MKGLTMTLKPILIDASSAENGYTRLLGGPPQSVFMRSGKVVLQPGESVGNHSTEGKEELIIILNGEGEFLYGDRHSLVFQSNAVLYCPPMTEHNILNTGSTPLHYIYVVSKALQ
jgi:oxalate decarboxylase/phosphoglucose isomerase-like protein (cupin superfamily)